MYTKEEIRELIPVLQAWVDGQPIEWRAGECDTSLWEKWDRDTIDLGEVKGMHITTWNNYRISVVGNPAPQLEDCPICHKPHIEKPGTL